MNVNRSYKLVKNYVKKSKDITNQTIVDNKGWVIDVNIEQMTDKGQTADEKSLGEYSPASIAMGKRPGHIQLHDTGDFHGAMKLKKEEKNKFVIDSTDWKTGMLEREYGMIFGLNKKNLSELAEEIYKDLYKELKVYFK